MASIAGMGFSNRRCLIRSGQLPRRGRLKPASPFPPGACRSASDPIAAVQSAAVATRNLTFIRFRQTSEPGPVTEWRLSGNLAQVTNLRSAL